MKPIRLGSRGSPLALAQTQEVKDQLQHLFPQREFVIVKVKTKGDKVRNVPLPKIGGKGLFVKEIELALLAGEVDVAVHSFKDLPTQPIPGLEVAAFTPRLDPRDALVSREGLSLDELPPGAVLGTSSPRRMALIKALRPDLEVIPMRGNLDTRLRKIERGEVAGAILAAAGLLRMGWQHRITHYLPPQVWIPAVGQGALAVEIREGDGEIKEMVRPLDHLPTRQAITAERAFLDTLRGGCHLPAAALGEVRDNLLHLWGMVASPDGQRLVRGEVEGEPDKAAELGRQLAQKLLGMGAGEIREIWAKSIS